MKYKHFTLMALGIYSKRERKRKQDKNEDGESETKNETKRFKQEFCLLLQ